MKPCTKFHQNRPSIIEDIRKKYFGLLFPDTHAVVCLTDYSYM